MKIRTRLLITSIILVAVGFYWLVDWIEKDVRLHYFITMEESMVDSSVLLSSLLARQLESEQVAVNELFRAGFADAARRDFSAQIYDFTKTRMNVRVLVTDKVGIVVYDSFNGEAEGEDYSNWRDVRLTLKGEYGARASYMVKGDPTSLNFFVASPLVVNGEIVGAVSIGKPVSSVEPFIQKAKRRFVISGIIAVIAILFVQVLVSAWVTQPIRKLIAYAQAVRDGRKVQRPRLVRSEMGELANAFEEMRDALEGREYVEDYVQALTHEMKSPLAAIQGAAELMGEEMTESQRARFLKNIKAESERMHGLVDRMLALAGLESRKELTAAAPVDAQALINDVIDSLLPLIRKKNIHMERVVEENVELHGEYFLLRQAAANLIQNAVEFSPEGGTVQVEIRREDDVVEIRIRDEGPGLPEYALKRVFERFYSLPRPDSGLKSSGLGLNFVREAAVLHGGTVELVNREPRGAEAILSIPCV